MIFSYSYTNCKAYSFCWVFFLLTLFMMPGITWVKSENAKYQIMTRPHSKYSCNPILCAVVLFFVFVSFFIHVLCIKCSLCLFTLSFIIVRSPLAHITNGIRNDQCLSTNHVTIDFCYLSYTPNTVNVTILIYQFAKICVIATIFIYMSPKCGTCL